MKYVGTTVRFFFFPGFQSMNNHQLRYRILCTSFSFVPTLFFWAPLFCTVRPVFFLERLEWVPGPGGHLRWYIDDVEVLGIDADTVEKHGTQVPWSIFDAVSGFAVDKAGAGSDPVVVFIKPLPVFQFESPR